MRHLLKWLIRFAVRVSYYGVGDGPIFLRRCLSTITITTADRLVKVEYGGAFLAGCSENGHRKGKAQL